jgi:Zn-dependent M28 family amino/carboxypeptidase
MMNRITPVFLLLLAACQPTITPESVQLDITVESLKQHILVLADDSMQGRAPASPGEEKTVAYLVAQFEAMGLKPGNNGSFIQEVPVLAQTTRRDAKMTLRLGGRTVQSFSFGPDFVVSPYAAFTEIDIKDAELVYVGYGIQAPEEGWDDYKGLDVKGKILVFKNSDPSSFPDKFAGNARLYYGRWSYKFEKAQELGALGALIVHTTPTAGYPWAVVQNSFGRERFDLIEENTGSPTQVQGWISSQTSVSIFERAGLDLQKLMDSAESADFKPISLGRTRLSINAVADVRNIVLKNVIGVLPGSDTTLKDEYVVFSAHHDHLGMAPTPVNGDSIYNGALDNASGTSAFLNIAKAFSNVPNHHHRSLLFVAVGGEESGLLGANYFAANPTVPPAKMAANINIDGINIFGRTTDIVSVGFGKNTLDEVIRAEAAKDGRTVKPDAFPEQGFFYRSDHFAFAKIGVPALYTNRGTDFIGKPEDYATTVAEDYTRNRYHAVGDEYNDSWDLSGAVDDVRLLFRVALSVANNPVMPTWYPGNEFEAARLKSLEKN